MAPCPKLRKVKTRCLLCDWALTRSTVVVKVGSRCQIGGDGDCAMVEDVAGSGTGPGLLCDIFLPPELLNVGWIMRSPRVWSDRSTSGVCMLSLPLAAHVLRSPPRALGTTHLVPQFL